MELKPRPAQKHGCLKIKDEIRHTVAEGNGRYPHSIMFKQALKTFPILIKFAGRFQSPDS